MKSLEELKAILPEGEEADIAQEEAGSEAFSPKSHPRLDIILDKKNRKGKAATIICGFTCGDAEVASIAGKLKQKLGTGGSARGGEILIQGDKRQQALSALISLGFKARVI